MIKKKFLLSLVLGIVFFLSNFKTNVSATVIPDGSDVSVICDILPFLKDIQFLDINLSLCLPDSPEANTLGIIGSLIQLGLSLIFVGIILLSVFYIIKSALVYIRSEGDGDKVKDAKKSIQSVFVGIGMLFVGILGIVLVVTLLGANEGLDADTEIEFDSNTQENIDSLLK